MNRSYKNIILMFLLGMATIAVIFGIYHGLRNHLGQEEVANRADNQQVALQAGITPEQAADLQKILKKSYWRALQSSAALYEGLTTSLVDAAVKPAVKQQAVQVKENVGQFIHTFLQNLTLTPGQAVKAHTIVKTFNEYIQKSKAVGQGALIDPAIEEELNQLHLKLVVQIGPLLNMLQSDKLSPQLQDIINKVLEFIEQIVGQTLKDLQIFNPGMAHVVQSENELIEPLVPQIQEIDLEILEQE